MIFCFCFARYTTDAFMAITEYVYQVLENNIEAQAVALDISKLFDRFLVSYVSFRATVLQDNCLI